MAELSAETQAILSRLKQEGDLSRNSGTNSIRSVKIQLDRFEGIFNSISTNVAEQTDILRVQTGLAVEAAERQNTKEQYEELEPPVKTSPADTSDNSNNSDTNDATNNRINSMGDSIAKALSFKNLAIAAAGGFVGYNLLKGFIDQKTGGGFSEFEKNLLPTAKSLKEMPKEIKKNMDTFRKEFQEDMDGFKEDMNVLKKDIGDMSKSVQNFVKRMDGMLDNLTSLSTYTNLILSSISALMAYTATIKLATKLIDLKKLGAGKTPDLDGKPPSDIDPEKAPKRNFTYDQKSNTYTSNTTGKVLTGGAAKTAEVTRLADEALAKSTSNTSKLASTLDVENSISSPAMRKVFVKLAKGLGAVGVVLTVTEAVQLAALLNSDKPEDVKRRAIGAFAGSLIGAGALGTAGAITGAFGGPWGAIILGVIGAGLGALGGELIGEYIADWAFDASVKDEDIKKYQDAVGLDTSLFDVEPRPTSAANPRALAGARKSWDALYKQTHNADGTPKTASSAISYAAPGINTPSIISEEAKELEQIAGYTADLQNRQLLESIYPSQTATGKKLQGVDLLSFGVNNNSTPVIINAPTIAPSSVNVSNGGSSLSQVSVSTGGGGGGSMMPYGLTGAFS